MAACALIDGKLQIAERKFSDRRQRAAQRCQIAPADPQPLCRRRAVAGQQLADPDIRLVQRVLLPEAVLPGVFKPQALRALGADKDLVKYRQQPAVVNVGMRDEDGLLSPVKLRHKLPEQRQHLLLIAGIAAVKEQNVLSMRQDRRIAAARRLDERERRFLRQAAGCDARAERFAAAFGQQLREAADGVERAVGR